MSVPKFELITLPLLHYASDGAVHTIRETRAALAPILGISAADEAELLPSGKQARWANRVTWAKVYLDAAGLVESTRRGAFRITERGKQVLGAPPEKINVQFLMRYPEFAEWQRGSKSQPLEPQPMPESTETPEEAIQEAYKTIRRFLAADLLERVKAATPRFFEELVVELLLNMGYGGSRAEAGEAIGRSGDEGIDGVINEDRLGLNTIYIQAKKWDGSVSRPEIQKFVGALQGKRARKGVFITTSTFTAEARSYASNIDTKVVLIDGRQLAEYMIDFNVGVTKKETYEIKRVDGDYFAEE